MSASPARSDAGADNSNLNLTRPLAPSPAATALFGANAALQVEGLRALLCEKPLQPSRPAHVKAYADPDDITETEWGDVHCASAVVESRMFMADQLLSLVYKANAGPHPTHFHQEWDRLLLFGNNNGGAAEVKDVVVPLDNIVRPLSEIIFPVCDDDNNSDGARDAAAVASSSLSPVLLRHAAQIPPSAGHVEGDWSQRAHDSSVPSVQQTDAQSPRRLRIARAAPDEFAQDKRGASDSDADNHSGSFSAQAAAEASAKRELAVVAPPSAGESSSASRQRGGGGGAVAPVMSNLLLGGRPAGLKDVERKQRSAEMHQLSAEERAKLVCRREAQKSRARPVIYRWRLSTVAVGGATATTTAAGSIVALAAAPISATAVHRCSIQILSHANVDGVDAVPAGTTALANGAFFDRPAACFGLANRQVLASAAHAAKPELWNALCWKSSGTMPAAAMMSAVSATGMPQLELPRFGREHNREHYIKIGDVLTIETRPVVASASSASAGSSSYINQFLSNNSNGGGAGAKQQLAGVSVSFFINSVLVHSYDNIARLQPYSKAASAGAATLTALPHPSQQQQNGSSASFLQQGLERSPFCVDFMYFAVRLWPGTEVAIVSGDTNRILEPAAAQTTRASMQ